ncbi:STAS domain-containing protein [Pseudonocardia endophytica]|uniref:STAS domain-containing protein n=1 Tax=Pseudonocardia endophytica TaxID=401976 RepID=A0A4R1HPI7_PSEEN|nr:STAS domain-containing protein [Pseudonocardia endophytica]TCK23063.1 STAS domain-containing protein [Pseudonocardia endophytica]
MTTVDPVTRLSLDGPDRPGPDGSGVHVLHVRGPLDRAAGARLLRLADARLALVRAGTRHDRHLVVDVSGVTGTDTGGLAALRHLRFACDRLGIGVHLAGTDALGHAGAHLGGQLAGFDRYPTAAVAVRALCAS